MRMSILCFTRVGSSNLSWGIFGHLRPHRFPFHNSGTAAPRGVWRCHVDDERDSQPFCVEPVQSLYAMLLRRQDMKVHCTQTTLSTQRVDHGRYRHGRVRSRLLKEHTDDAPRPTTAMRASSREADGEIVLYMHVVCGPNPVAPSTPVPAMPAAAAPASSSATPGSHSAHCPVCALSSFAASRDLIARNPSLPYSALLLLPCSAYQVSLTSRMRARDVDDG